VINPNFFTLLIFYRCIFEFFGVNQIIYIWIIFLDFHINFELKLLWLTNSSSSYVVTCVSTNGAPRENVKNVENIWHILDDGRKRTFWMFSLNWIFQISWVTLPETQEPTPNNSEKIYFFSMDGSVMILNAKTPLHFFKSGTGIRCGTYKYFLGYEIPFFLWLWASCPIFLDVFLLNFLNAESYNAVSSIGG
jgi:hypothetical protein